MRDWTVCALSARFQAGEITSEALVAECIRRVESFPSQDAFVFLDAERALASARASDERRKKGIARGVLDGIPYALEDRFCTKGMPTENGCHMLSGYVPVYDAEIVNRLRAEGAILLGKLATDGFLAGSVQIKRAAAITTKMLAEGAFPFAICADTGGSAFCEEAKAVVSRFPNQPLDRSGLISAAPSFDGIAAVTQSIGDAALLFEILSSFVNEPRCLKKGNSPGIIDLDLTDFSLEKVRKSYRILSAVETASEMALYDGIRFGASADESESVDARVSKTRGTFFSYDEKKMILLGTALLMDGRRETCYLSARSYREEVRKKVDTILTRADVIRIPLSEQTACLPSYLGLSAVAVDRMILMTSEERGRLLFDAVTFREEGDAHE